MVAVGNHLRMTVTQRMVGVDADLLNVYYWRVTGANGSPILSELAGAFETWYTEDFVANIKGIQPTTLTHQQLFIESMENWATEFVTVPLSPPVAGDQPTAASSSVLTWSFKLARTLRTTRNGRKSIPGVPEGLVDNNVPNSGATTALAAISLNLSQGWTIDGGAAGLIDIVPVIAKTPIPPATRPTVYNDITAAPFVGVGTQGTRKRLVS